MLKKTKKTISWWPFHENPFSGHKWDCFSHANSVASSFIPTSLWAQEGLNGFRKVRFIISQATASKTTEEVQLCLFFQTKLFLFGATFLSVSATFWKNTAYFLLEMLPAQFCKGDKEREILRNMIFGNYYLILSHRQQVSDNHLFYLPWIIQFT